MGLCGLVALGFVEARSGPVPFAIGVVLAVLPVPALVAAVLALDRFEPEPTRKLAIAFFWGASVAVLLAGVLNTVGLSITQDLLGTAEGRAVSVAIGAPIVEETLKGLVILGLMIFARRELDGPTDGIIYAGMVGLGFAMTENVLYYTRAVLEHGAGGLVGTFILRGVVTPFAHPLFTAMIGMALGYAAITRNRPLRYLLPVLGLFAAMILHGLWNAAATTAILYLAFVYLAVLLPVLLIVIAVTLVDRRRMVQLVSRHLPRYGDQGVVTTEDINMLSKLRYRRRARFWAKANGGANAARAMRHYQLAAVELALLDARVERGQDDPVRTGPRRDALLRLMAAARSAFLPAPARRPPWVLGA